MWGDMKRSNTNDRFKPFEKLKNLVEKKDIELSPRHRAAPPGARSRPRPARPSNRQYAVDDDRLFAKAMSDVIPMGRNTASCKRISKPGSPAVSVDPDQDAQRQLEKLIQNGKGFIISLTPEYIEGVSGNAHPEITKKLHQGDISIQDYIDLHGYGVMEARDALNRFLNRSISIGLRAVLIVHGRGLSSPGDPVLKNKAIEWLTRGKWKKWVAAFTSARKCDGGTGATYVLLRTRPLSKRLLKQNIIRRIV